MALHFAAPLSPWWLLLCLPLAVAASVWFYRRQWRELSRAQAAGLVLLRSLLVAGVVFLAFRPSLLWRTILTFPSRLVLLLDDSESMTARDTGLTGPEALRRARLLSGTAGEAAAPVHDLARRVEAIADGLWRYERFVRAADRTAERFWAETERVGQDLGGRFDELARMAQGVTGLNGEVRGAWDETIASLPETRGGVQALFAGNVAPSAQSFRACQRALAELRDRFYRLQADLDRAALADPKHPWQAVVDRERARSRLDVMKAGLDGLSAYAAEELKGQFVECRRLMTGAGVPLDEFKAGGLESAPGATDLLEPVNRLLREENPFPLAGIVLVTDGRHLGGGSAGATAQLAAQRETPVSAAAIGAPREPWDLAILGAVAAPFAVKGTPAGVRVDLKTVLPEPAEARVDLLLDGRAAAGETVKAGPASSALCVSRFTPETLGRHRYTVRVSSLPAEIVPARNNSRDLVVNVREDKVRVLLLDWKPRWETRFLLNILQRLDFVELNATIAVTREDAALARGIRKGTWPQDRATLALYDLIVIGDIPANLLTAGEWADLRDAVEKGGKTLCLLGGAGGSVLPAGDVRQALWPLADAPVPSGPATAGPPTAGPAGDGAPSDPFCLTESGRLHPLTEAMARDFPVTGEAGISGLRPDTCALALAAPGGQPVIATRRAGKGQVLLVGDDRLWKRLNPGHLDAHTALYVNLVSWAVEADRLAADGSEALLLDRHVLPAGRGLQVWASAGATGTVVEAVIGERVVASRALERMRPGAAFACATFPALPAGDLRFRLQGGSVVSGTVMVVDDSPELGLLARDDTVLAALAGGSGGRVAEVTDVRRLLSEFAPRERVEKKERIWRLWDMPLVFAFLLGILTVEWIWRKWVGLV
jgi:hypothetical protein